MSDTEGVQRLCASLAARDPHALEGLLGKARGRCGIAEIRLDALKRPDDLDIRGLIEKCGIELLFTCRRREEGGAFQGDEAARIELIKRCCEAGAAFVDIELASGREAVSQVKQAAAASGTGMICSWHQFSGHPGRRRLCSVLEEMKGLRADVAKIVTTPRNSTDLVDLFSLYPLAQEQKMALIAFGMGRRGKISRLTSLLLGAPFAYCSLESGGATAPGQLTLAEMEALLPHFI